MYQEMFSGKKDKEALKKQMKRISTADHLVAKIIREPEIDLKKLFMMSKRHLDEINKLVRVPRLQADHLRHPLRPVGGEPHQEFRIVVTRRLERASVFLELEYAKQ